MFEQENYQPISIIIIQGIIVRQFQRNHSLLKLNNQQLTHFQNQLINELSKNIRFMSYVQNTNNSFRSSFIKIIHQMYKKIGRKQDFTHLNKRLNQLKHYQIVDDIISRLYGQPLVLFQHKFESLQQFNFTYQSLIAFAKQVSNINIKEANQCQIEESTVQLIKSFLRDQQNISQNRSEKQQCKHDKKDDSSESASFSYKSSCQSQKSQRSQTFSNRQRQYVHFDKYECNDNQENCSQKSSFQKKQIKQQRQQKIKKNQYKKEDRHFIKDSYCKKQQQDDKNEITMKNNQQVVIHMKISLNIQKQANKYQRQAMSTTPSRSDPLQCYNFRTSNCFSSCEIDNNLLNSLTQSSCKEYKYQKNQKQKQGLKEYKDKEFLKDKFELQKKKQNIYQEKMQSNYHKKQPQIVG